MATDPYLRLKVRDGKKRTSVSFGRADMDGPESKVRNFLWNFTLTHRDQLSIEEMRLLAGFHKLIPVTNDMGDVLNIFNIHQINLTLKKLERLAPDADLQLLELLDRHYPGQFDHIK